MNTRKAIAAVAAAVLAVSTTACSSPGAPTAAPGTNQAPASSTADLPELRIAVNTWLSGTYAVFGIPQTNAWKIAADDVNANGGLEVAGKRYKVVIQADDNKADPTTTRSVTESEISSGIKIIKTSGDPTDPQIIPLIEEHHVLLIDNTANQQYAGPPYNYTILTWLPPHVYAKLAFEEYAKLQTVKSVWGIGVDAQFDHMILGGAKLGATEAGLQWLGQTFYQQGALDFASILSAAVNSHADLITFGSPGSDAPAIVTTLRQLGFKGLITSVPESVSLESIVEGAKDGAENVCQTENFTYPYTDALTEFKAAYQAMAGDWTPFATFYYNEAFFTFAGIQEAGSIDDPDAIKAALATVSVDNPFMSQAQLKLSPDPNWRVVLAPVAINCYQNGTMTTVAVLSPDDYAPYEPAVISGD